mmetsp:Transcript_29251/g.70574  ORF Transcript_29251/g.70574 Transcript_29251/m.70574 type:complete len:84 (+) Transcript_29251:644-895(+)
MILYLVALKLKHLTTSRERESIVFDALTYPRCQLDPFPPSLVLFLTRSGISIHSSLIPSIFGRTRLLFSYLFHHPYNNIHIAW